MWNTQSCSKILQHQTQQKNYQIHRKKLLSMQSCIKLQQPIQPQFLYTKNKSDVKNKQKAYQIDRVNHILLNKIQLIRQQQNNINKLKPQNNNFKIMSKKSMKLMRRQLKQQNQKICQKLINAQSHYHTNDMLQKADHLQYVASNISKNARRCISASAIKLHPLNKSSTTFSSFNKKKSNQYKRPIYKLQKIHTKPSSLSKLKTSNQLTQQKLFLPLSSKQQYQPVLNQEQF